MIGWLLPLSLASFTAVALWRFARLPRGAEGFVGAAVLLAVAGYAWQGRPDLAGAPSAAPDEAVLPDTTFARDRLTMLGRFGDSGQWLDFADALERMGEHRAAVNALKTALDRNPRSAELWVGLGNALIVHADGLVTPAARLAFDRAAVLAPSHPAPPFFLGLALAQAGELDEAASLWHRLLARSAAGAAYRADLTKRLARLDALRAGR